MRKIEFRGIDKKGKWRYGSLVITDQYIKKMEKQHTKTWIVSSAFGNGGWFNILQRNFVLENTIGQYTGLKDKNGKEIYADDIVKDTSGYLYQVVWLNKKARFAYICKLGSETNMNQKKDIEDGIEIVGNVHENKELFEVKR